MTIKERNTSEIRLIDLAAPVARDAEGWWSNPHMPNFDEGAEEEYRAWLAGQGIEIKFFSLEHEDMDHPAYVNYYDEGGIDVSLWMCAAPAGEGWYTLSIHDSEDGPVWVWARRPANGAQP